MNSWLLWSPVVFLVALAASLGLYTLMGVLSIPFNRKPGSGGMKSYACGEDVPDHRAQPDYAQFFPFAFFFTIMHVFALIVATVPGGSPVAAAIAVGYVMVSAVGLYILFRK